MKDGQTIGQWLNWDFEANGDLIIDNKKNQRIYHENEELWIKRQYDSQGNQIYFEDSDGEIVDNRYPEIIEHNGRKYQLIL